MQDSAHIPVPSGRQAGGAADTCHGVGALGPSSGRGVSGGKKRAMALVARGLWWKEEGQVRTEGFSWEM